MRLEMLIRLQDFLEQKIVECQQIMNQQYNELMRLHGELKYKSKEYEC